MASPTLWLKNQNPLFEMTNSSDFMPVMAWSTDPETGKRRPSDKQAVTIDGLPIWEIRVIATQDVYGRAEDTFLSLRVASTSKPNPASLAKVSVAE